jgi:hypothetical protein
MAKLARGCEKQAAALTGDSEQSVPRVRLAVVGELRLEFSPRQNPGPRNKLHVNMVAVVQESLDRTGCDEDAGN